MFLAAFCNMASPVFDLEKEEMLHSTTCGETPGHTRTRTACVSETRYLCGFHMVDTDEGAGGGGGGGGAGGGGGGDWR